jgi:hypothetical protein
MSSKKAEKPEVKCPSELEEIIELVNSLPKNVLSVYKNLKEKYESEEQYLIEQTQINPNDIDIKMDLTHLPRKYEKEIKSLFSENIYFYVKGVLEFQFSEINFGVGFDSILEPLDKLFELMKIKWLLTQIAELTSLEFDVLHTATELIFQPIINFGVDENGNIKPATNPLVEIFNKKNIPLERIRLCPICKDIFWALKVSQDNVEKKYKSDSITCSPPCSNTRRGAKKRIKDYKKRLAEETAKLEKLQLKNLMSDNDLISEQKEKIKKAENLIEKNKRMTENHLETQRRKYFEIKMEENKSVSL